MKVIVIATDNRFWRRVLGSHTRICQFISSLDQRGVVVKIFFTGTPTDDDLEALAKTQFDIHFANMGKGHEQPFWPSFPHKLLVKSNYLVRRFALWFHDLLISGRIDKSPILQSYESPSLQLAFKQYIKKIRPDVVFIEYLRLDYLINTIERDFIAVMDTLDVSYQRHREFSKQGRASDLRVSKRTEIRKLKKYDCVLAIQEVDHLEYQRQGLRNIVLVPHPMKSTRLDVNRDYSIVRLGFVGSDMEPNIDGIQWFIDHVLTRMDEVKLNIYGSVCGKINTESEKIELHGVVSTVDSIYRYNDIMINPVIYGGGLKIKSVEALSYGRPLVSTSVGIAGMARGEGIVVCSDPDSWVQALALFRNEEYLDDMSSKAITYIERYYSHDTCFEELFSNINV